MYSLVDQSYPRVPWHAPRSANEGQRFNLESFFSFHMVIMASTSAVSLSRRALGTSLLRSRHFTSPRPSCLGCLVISSIVPIWCLHACYFLFSAHAVTAQNLKSGYSSCGDEEICSSLGHVKPRWRMVSWQVSSAANHRCRLDSP